MFMKDILRLQCNKEDNIFVYWVYVNKKYIMHL